MATPRMSANMSLNAGGAEGSMLRVHLYRMPFGSKERIPRISYIVGEVSLESSYPRYVNAPEGINRVLLGTFMISSIHSAYNI
jgi:hypothetical protein